MVASRATLPDLNALTPDELKALIVSQHEQIASRDSEIEQLKLLIAKLRRMQFGRSSEKLDRQIEQLELRLEALQQNDAEALAAKPQAMVSEESARSGRRPLPAQLPREIRTHLPKQEACPDCGGELRKLGEDVSEVLERIRLGSWCSGMYASSWPARVASASCKRRHRAARSNAALPDRGFSPTCWFRSLVIICRCIGNRKSTLEKEWNWIVRRWRTGWERRAD